MPDKSEILTKILAIIFVIIKTIIINAFDNESDQFSFHYKS